VSVPTGTVRLRRDPGTRGCPRRRRHWRQSGARDRHPGAGGPCRRGPDGSATRPASRLPTAHPAEPTTSASTGSCRR